GAEVRERRPRANRVLRRLRSYDQDQGRRPRHDQLDRQSAIPGVHGHHVRSAREHSDRAPGPSGIGPEPSAPNPRTIQTEGFMRAFPVLFAGLILSAAVALAAVDPALLALVSPDARLVTGIQVDQSKASKFGQFVLSQITDNEDLKKFVSDSGF